MLRSWFGLRADDDFIWEVCHLCGQEGWNELPSPLLSPRKPRELLRAIVAVLAVFIRLIFAAQKDKNIHLVDLSTRQLVN